MSFRVRWRIINFLSLHIEEWDGEFTVFQPESGKTHFLNQMGMQILINLNNQPLSAVSEAEICENLVRQFQLHSEPALVEQIHKTLRRFEELGLIEQIRQDITSAR